MIYLASKSPQRKGLLRKARIAFKVIPSHYRERISSKRSASQNAIQNALGKALHVSRKTGLILSADTLVCFRGKIVGKVAGFKKAEKLLKSFSGKSQWVYTGVALRDVTTGKVLTFCDKSKVTFRRMSLKDIRNYLKTGEYIEKAGAFALQGKGSRFIRGVTGSRSNVIGLPMERLKSALRVFGVC